MDAPLTICRCERSDIARIVHLQPEGWNPLSDAFELFCSAPFCHPVIGFSGPDVVGIANGIVNGRTGWLSHIIVDESRRRGGFGTQLTRYIMEYLRAQGCATQLLIATALGEPVYAKLGFETVSVYHFYRPSEVGALGSEAARAPEAAPAKARTASPRAPHPGVEKRENARPDMRNIRRLAPEDYADLYRMDQELMGEARRAMLERFDTSGWGCFDAHKQGLRGYYLPGVGEGLIVARDSKAGIELLKLKLDRTDGKTVVPAENTQANDLLAECGYERFLEAPRMALGERISWEPRALFSRIGGWYG